MTTTPSAFVDTINVNEISQSQGFDSAAQIATENEHNLSFREAFRRYPTAAFWAIAISFTIVMEGYDTILMGNFYAYPAFRRKYGTYYPDLGEWEIDASWQAALGDAATCGSFVGLLINGYVTEKFGHRHVIMAALVVMSAFIFLPFFAPNIQVLLAGQVLCGIPWGIFAIMGSSYASEVCPLALRGFLTSFVNICWVIGQLIAAGVLQGLVSNTTEWGYRIPFAIQWSWPIPLFLVALFAPDSPWWLVRKGRLADAEKALVRLSSSSTLAEIRLKLAMMVHTDKLEQAMRTESSTLDCFRGTNLRRTEIACMVLAAQELSGEAFAYGSTYFFTQAGLSSSNSYKLNFGGTGVAFAATCGSWVAMNFFGRRTMIITGMTIMSLLLLIIGVLSYPAVHNDGATWTQAVLTLVWLGVYSLTLGPQSFALAAEISATRVRSQTIALARNSYNVVQIICNTVEPYLINPTEANLKGKTAFVWMATAILTLIWCIFRLPETKDLTYEELDILFEKGVPAWRFKRTNGDLRSKDTGGASIGREESHSSDSDEADAR
ncbi:general substrate transporter [Mollisia scopiformis]|uniref:General substrate transporter n=1 Tax=Mollisia scopiformis TaxID=149040 RepID=A0A194XTT5_MOLSC|nr:general substrate transporter [Mollisia scopiformis]KUJ23730.1 general substrate transporter [Mollisia scopiformis]